MNEIYIRVGLFAIFLIGFGIYFSLSSPILNSTKLACDELKPNWADYSSGYGSIGMFPHCTFTKGNDWKEAEYRQEEYYLIDFNRLGKVR